MSISVTWRLWQCLILLLFLKFSHLIYVLAILLFYYEFPWWLMILRTFSNVMAIEISLCTVFLFFVYFLLDFKNWFVGSTFYVFDVNPLSDTCAANIYSQSLVHLFSLLMRFKLSTVYVMANFFFFLYFKKPLPTQNFEDSFLLKIAVLLFLTLHS